MWRSWGCARPEPKRLVFKASKASFLRPTKLTPLLKPQTSSKTNLLFRMFHVKRVCFIEKATSLKSSKCWPKVSAMSSKSSKYTKIWCRKWAAITLPISHCMLCGSLQSQSGMVTKWFSGRPGAVKAVLSSHASFNGICQTASFRSRLAINPPFGKRLKIPLMDKRNSRWHCSPYVCHDKDALYQVSTQGWPGKGALRFLDDYQSQQPINAS